MGKFKVKRQPSGLINGLPWPEPGEELELDDQVGQDMADAGWLEAAKAEKKTEKRPASKKDVEKR